MIDESPFEWVVINYFFLFHITFSNTDSNCISLLVIFIPSFHSPLLFIASSVIHNGGSTVTVFYTNFSRFD